MKTIKNIVKKLGIGFLASFLLVSVAQAQMDIGLSSDSDLQLEAELNSNTDNSMNSETTIDSEIDSEVDTEVEQDDQTTEEVFMLNLNSNGQTSLMTNDSGLMVESSSQVGSEADLEVFKTNVSTGLENVAEVETSEEEDTDTEVVVRYKHKGRLFGFIPVTVRSLTRVEASDDGETKVSSRLPWWSFLVAGEDFNRGAMEMRLRNNASIQANAKANVGAQAKARIAEAIVAELESASEVQANMEASASTR